MKPDEQNRSRGKPLVSPEMRYHGSHIEPIGPISSKEMKLPIVKSGMKRRARAFTLIELLVVISIIGILAALLSPALSAAKKRAKSIQCVNDVRQIGIAFNLYAQEHDDHLMQRYYGFNANGVEIGYDELLVPYITRHNTLTNDARIFVCPSQLQSDYPHQPGYGMNWYYDNIKVGAILNQSDTILVAETLGPNDTGSHRADRDSVDPGELDSERHTGQANYLFLDNHVTVLKWTDTAAPVDLWGTDQGIHDKTLGN